MKICVLGTDSAEINDINNGKNTRYFDGISLPKAVTATGDIEAALDGAEMVLIAVPTRFVADVLETAKPYLSRSVRVVNVSKGFDPNTNNRMTDTVRRVLGEVLDVPIVSVIGPSHAEEVIRRELTSICGKIRSGDFLKLVSQTLRQHRRGRRGVFVCDEKRDSHSIGNFSRSRLRRQCQGGTRYPRTCRDDALCLGKGCTT